LNPLHHAPIRPGRTIVAALLSLVLAGCIGLLPSPFRPSPGPQATPQVRDLAEAFDVVCRNYRVGPDDEIGMLVQMQWKTEPGSYLLDTLDRVRIDCLIDPQLSSEATIRPDGCITVRGIGDIQAAGLKPDELAKKIELEFLKAKIFTESVTRKDLGNFRLVTVEVLQFQQKVKELMETFRTLTSGARYGVIVKPDGTIDLPLLRDRVLAAGYTVPEIERTVSRLYRETVLEHAVVSMQLSRALSRKFYVLGEVGGPGAYEIRQPITALQALALAGGHKADTADLTSVILISRNTEGKPFGRRLDLKKIMDVGDMSSAILVKPYDVLFVPKTYISDVRLFIDQYLSVITDVNSLVKALSPTNTSP
jgi:polysaccharide biosynthesis/export protein